jgi:hypothetical protein
MIKKIRELNEALPGMLLIDLIYLIIGEAIIWIFFSDPLKYAIGFFAGILYSVFSAFHLSLRIRKVVYGHANSSTTLLIGYFVRLLVIFALFAVLYWCNIGDLIAAVIGMLSMKVSAYLQPLTHRVVSKIITKGR